ncbi:hypothetical protein [Enterobacter sp. R1(2018)]|jgi:hypothetical protein|nr:hypothetical protein [Enterobacter sp. R1(2018)]
MSERPDFVDPLPDDEPVPRVPDDEEPLPDDFDPEDPDEIIEPGDPVRPL